MKRQIPEDVLYDKRLIERHIKAGFFTSEEWEKRVAGSADLGEQASNLEIEANAANKGASPRR
ncbi:MAG: hypothetical protein EOO66_11820 [Methylobacterium sp.]|nr:MAG: hypothetical protein EOO66_11820 [Methylobacterium sp.]